MQTINNLQFPKIRGLEELGRFDQAIKELRRYNIPDELIRLYASNVAYLKKDGLSRLRKGHKIYQSTKGFISDDEGLFEVMFNDYQTLRKNNTNHRKLGGKLEDIVEKAKLLSDPTTNIKPVIVDGLYEVEIAYSGIQECPFEEKGFDGGSVKIKNLKTGKTTKVQTISAHLIKEHGFFEGDVPYRVDPRDLIEVLEGSVKRKPENPYTFTNPFEKYRNPLEIHNPYTQLKAA